MFITGYHGTKEKFVQDILKSGYFLSKGNQNWLGDGIYFYYNIEDAYNWRETEVITHSVIKINSDEYLDWDSSEGNELGYRMSKYLSEKFPDIFKGKESENQCAFMKMIWDSFSNLKVMSCEFAPEPRKIKMLVDFRARRKEFCVRDNSVIKLTQAIRKDDLDD